MTTQLYFTRATAPHYVANWDKSRLPKNAAYYSDSWGFDDFPIEARYVQLAYKTGVLVGFFRYEIEKAGKKVWLNAAGTWVDPKYRRSKVAFTLWDRAIQHAKPTGILVLTTSSKGYRFTKTLEAHYTDIDFRIHQTY